MVAAQVDPERLLFVDEMGVHTSLAPLYGYAPKGVRLRLSVPRAGAPNERVVTPPPYHHVLAARIGCRREQVTREFTTMGQEALIERTRGALVIKRPDVFESRIADAMREDAG